MRSLWIKIGLGAAGIFVVGMMGLTLVRNARNAAMTAFHNAVDRAPAPLHAMTNPATHGLVRLAALSELQRVAGTSNFQVDVPFRLDGSDLGVLSRGTIRRVRANALPTVTLEVSLTARNASARLEDCILVPLRHRDADFGGGFRCAEAGEGGLLTFGTVRFTPGGFSRPLMISQDQALDLQRGEPFEASADLRSGVKVEAQGRRGEQVRIRADENGANIRIHDELGNDLFRLLADSLGASLQVRNRDGREIVRFSAGDGRLSLSVDTVGH